MSDHGGPPERGDLYRHWKHQHLYLVLHLVCDVTTTEMTPMVVYRSIESGDVYCRTAKDFMEKVEVNSTQRDYRFRFVRQALELLGDDR